MAGRRRADPRGRPVDVPAQNSQRKLPPSRERSPSPIAALSRARAQGACHVLSDEVSGRWAKALASDSVASSWSTDQPLMTIRPEVPVRNVMVGGQACRSFTGAGPTKPTCVGLPGPLSTIVT